MQHHRMKSIIDPLIIPIVILFALYDQSAGGFDPNPTGSGGAGGEVVEWTQATEADWNTGTHNQTKNRGPDIELNSNSLSGEAYDDYLKSESGGLCASGGGDVTVQKAVSDDGWAGRTEGFGNGRVYFNFDIKGITNVNSAVLNINQCYLQGNPSPLYVDHVDFGDSLEEDDWDCHAYQSEFVTFTHGSNGSWQEIDVLSQLQEDIPAEVIILVVGMPVPAAPPVLTSATPTMVTLLPETLFLEPTMPVRLLRGI
jgi:hypothetical protein